MADVKGYMQPGHTVEDIDTVIDEVYEARGEYDSLDERLDDMEGGAPTPSTSIPAMDGTGSVGTSDQYARADHVHPSDTSKQNALSSTQLDAVNSGIDSTKVAQIETNKNNISSLQDQFKRSATAINDTIADNAKSGVVYGQISLTGITDAWGALTTYVLNSEGNRAIQVLYTENRNLRRFKGSGGWGAWTDI